MIEENPFYDLAQIKQALSGRIHEFVMEFYPEAKKESACYKIGSIDGEKGKSMMISTRPDNAGYFKDFANPNIAGPAWHLVAHKQNVSIKEAIRWLAQWLKIPAIQSFGNTTKSSNPVELASFMRELSNDSIEYAAGRHISEDTLRKYGVSNHRNGGIAFPYYDAFGNLGMVKKWGLQPKEDGKKDTWVTADPIMSLFGKDVCDPDTKLTRLVITEGEWDAMACYEMGIPAVSIPMGVSNTNWIKEDYQFLSHFDEIILMFDNDMAGQEAVKNVIERLGSERCLSVVVPLKDANDMLRANRVKEIHSLIEQAEREPMAEIVDPVSMKEGVRACMKGEHLSEGDPFFLPDFSLSFRPHEMTLWFGYSFHGKSQAVQNQVASLAAMGKMSCVASFEQPPQLTFAQILGCVTAYPNLPFTEEFDAAFEYVSEHVLMYKSMERTDPLHLVNTFIHAHKRYGVRTFVVDNVMTLNIDRGDNTAQAEAADLLRVFVSKYPVHLHIVAHPRKPPESVNKPAAMSEIRGAGEWGDMPHNIVSIWRDMSKAESIAEREDAMNSFSKEEIREFWESTPCGKIHVRKQRTTGDTPMTKFWYHKETNRFMQQPTHPSPMYDEKPWE